MSTPTLNLSVSYRAKTILLQNIDPHTSTIDSIKCQIVDSPQTHRLVYKGKSLFPDSSFLIDHIVPPTSQSKELKLMLLGSSALEIDAVHKHDTNHSIRVQQNARAVLARPKLQPPPTYCNTIRVLDEFSDKHLAMQLLDRLRRDWGVCTVMHKRGWTVGVLMELHPNERAILGYNRNKGQSIALRLRTNDLDGFRHYSTIQDTFIHELAHMTHTDHDSNFHALNRQLKKEIDAINHGNKVGGNRMNTYNGPSDPKLGDTASGQRFEGGTHVLGGGQLAAAIPTENADNRVSRKVLETAATLRLTEQEKEITEGCNTQLE
ncbi:hypothetical protein O5D80_002950 [Batrachochytrium dendrobatidis]|nr:hypothetical protein O5D80_002950 [Batrachochytrium dendrobatidis]